MSQSSWPAWFPYPISWIRAFANLASFAIVGHIASSSFYQRIRAREFEPEDLAVLILWCLIIHFFLLVLGHHSVTKLLKNRKTWWPGWLSWREGLNGSIVVVLEILGTSVFAFFLMLVLNPQTREEDRGFLSLVAIGFVTIAAYLYQYDFLVRQRRAVRRTVKRQPVKKAEKMAYSPPANPIDLELDRLRGEMGLNQMKKKPNNTN